MLPATRYVSFDCETSGFRSDARVLEIGCVLFEHGEPVDTWSSLIRPVGINWESEDVVEALGVNGLRREQFDGQPTFTEIFPRLFSYLRLARVWVAHNARFDLRMLNQEFQRNHGTNFPIVPQEGTLCTLTLERSLHPGVKGNKLEEVAVRWGVVPDGSH